MDSAYMRMDFARANGYRSPEVAGPSKCVRKTRSFSVGSYVLPSAWRWESFKYFGRLDFL